MPSLFLLLLGNSFQSIKTWRTWFLKGRLWNEKVQSTLFLTLIDDYALCEAIKDFQWILPPIITELCDNLSRKSHFSFSYQKHYLIDELIMIFNFAHLAFSLPFSSSFLFFSMGVVMITSTFTDWLCWGGWISPRCTFKRDFTHLKT